MLWPLNLSNVMKTEICKHIVRDKECSTAPHDRQLGALGVNKVSTISGWGPNTDNLEIFINNCQSLKILECSNSVYASWILRSAYYPRIIQCTNSFAYRQYVNCTRRQHRFILLSKVKNVGENNLISFSCQMLRHILSYLLADEIEK